MLALIFTLLFPFVHSAANQCKSMDEKLKQMRKVQHELTAHGIRGSARDYVNSQIDKGLVLPETALQRLAPTFIAKNIQFGGADKFAEHFSKHTKEFPGLSQKGYLKRAQEIAESMSEEFISFKTPYSVMKYNPATNELLVLHQNRIKTFFKPDLKFINDPLNRPRKEEFKSIFEWLVSEKVMDH